jgi:hypothetical protein
VIHLYEGSGAGDFTLEGVTLTDPVFASLRSRVQDLLRARKAGRALGLLQLYPFRLKDGRNHFNDEFQVLHAVVPLQLYEQARAQATADRTAFRQIANTFDELGHHVRFIAAELQPKEGVAAAKMNQSVGLTTAQISKLVQRYIGVKDGYLGDFSYQKHHDFYVELDLDINPFDYEGTTRQRLEQILRDAIPDVQARIVQGILDRFPVGSSEHRTQSLYDEVRSWIPRLRAGGGVPSPDPATSVEVVRRALADAEHLIRQAGATSAVDRVHTAVHGYLIHVCRNAGISTPKDASLVALFKLLRTQHSAFAGQKVRGGDIEKMLNSLTSVLDVLNPIRNNASVAHPNDELLPEAEAMLAVNCARTILSYLDTKVTTGL